MSNFDFVPEKIADIAEACRRAEAQVHGDPRAACFHARFALEGVVHWLYQHDQSLRMPYQHSLGALLHEPSFQNLLPGAVFQKATLIHKQGNLAVHKPRPVRQYDALQVVKELFHVCYWLVRSYGKSVPLDGVAWADAKVPRPINPEKVVAREQLEKLEAQLAKKHAAELAQQQERIAVDAELRELRAELTALREAAEATADPHDYSEADTRRYLIDVDLRRAGWALDQKRDVEYPVTGMPSARGVGYADYVLWGDDGRPLGVVEAKKTTADAAVGQQQAKLYADGLEQMHGRRPMIFYTNGYTTWLWDDAAYPARKVAGFYKKDELERLLQRRETRGPLDVAQVNEAIAGRYYQKRAIGSIGEQFAASRRKALLVMATGTGKTRTAIALVDLLQRAGWVKRALFLADRVSLVNQACNAFKAHLPDSSPVNLVTEKDKEGRVMVCTYPTMMGLIDQTNSTPGNTPGNAPGNGPGNGPGSGSGKSGEARFGVGHFDLIVIDEAHRSVYQKFGAIFEYFDALLVGLTATPREQVDKNTYELFELEPGVPTDAYELQKAVTDGFLVPPKVQQVDLRFPREGIDYDALSDEEKAQWEGLDWGDEADEAGLPSRVNAGAINSWLFNTDTVDKVLQHLMEHGHKVEGGDRLGKTIIFARNHDHAVFIEKRFNHHYPEKAGHFARVIDHYATYAQSLIDDFSIKAKDPHIAISVDMLDTGIDVPEVVNLVFFKPVYSKIKFWQMIGRGTRLCPDLFGPGEDKADFRVFDFCFNFDFFKENPDGIDAGSSAALGTRLFRARVQLAGHLQATQDLDPDGGLATGLIDGLHAEVASMNPENFIVRRKLEVVERFQTREAWETLSEDDRETLMREVADLPTQTPREEIESRLFDLTMLRMQLAQVEAEPAAFEKHRKRVVEIAQLLEDKTTIPAVKAQIEYLTRMQEVGFWEGMTLARLEELRLRVRGLMPFIDKQKRKIVYTDFKDEVVGIRIEDVVDMPTMTGVQYARKVEDYLKNHLNHIAIQRLRTNQPLTDADLQGLETTLVRIGEDDGASLWSGLLATSGSPSLEYFVRRLVGMDRSAAQAAFSGFLEDRSLTPPQIRFIEMLIDQLTAQGVVEASALYEPPFSNLNANGPDALFAGKEAVVARLFKTLDAVRPSRDVREG